VTPVQGSACGNGHALPRDRGEHNDEGGCGQCLPALIDGRDTPTAFESLSSRVMKSKPFYC
jgi:hypothetical protein